MPIYHQLGDVPHKRHTVFRKPDGWLYAEELIGNKGFTGPSSLLYHLHQPTPVRAVRTHRATSSGKRDPERQFRHRHFRTHQLESGGSLTLDRDPAAVQQRRRDALRAARSRGRLLLPKRAGRRGGLRERRATACSRRRLARSRSRSGDYLVIPRGILHRYRLDGRAEEVPRSSRAPATSGRRSGIATTTGSSRRWRRTPSATSGGPANLPTIDEKGDVPAGREEGEPAVRDDAGAITRSISSGGTASTIRGRSASTISSRASDASICRRRCTRHSKATASSCARSARGRTTSIRRRCRCPTTTRT